MKRFISLCVVVALVMTLLPSNVVQAETTSDITEAKAYIDAIVEAALPATAYTEDVYSEDLADKVVGLQNLLRSIVDDNDAEAALATLDAYVAGKTTVQISLDPENDPTGENGTTPHTYYNTIQAFTQAYCDAQNTILASLSQPITDKIATLLSEPLSRENYNQAQDAYDAASKHVRAAVLDDDVKVLDNIRELFDKMDSADRAFLRITIPSKDSEEQDYEWFVKDFNSAQTAYGLYESKFNNLKSSGRYATCLQKARKNALFANYAIYDEARCHYDVEKAYDDIGVYETLDDTVKEKLDVLQEAVDKGDESAYQISVYNYYRGEEIARELERYNRILTFEDMVAMSADVPANKAELAAALRAYRYYTTDLSEEEQKLVPEEYVTKIENAVLLNTNCETVKNAIDDIGTATSEEDYADYKQRYENAYKAYRQFVNKYSGLCDIPSLITNISALDEATEVHELINSIRLIEDTYDAEMLSKRLLMESLLESYNNMTADKQEQIYNIAGLKTIWEDTKAADELCEKIRVILNNHSLLDEERVAEIHSIYENLSENAKKYFGTKNKNDIQIIENDLTALNMNKGLVVVSQIDKIGTVDAHAGNRIRVAREAYDALTTAQRQYVNNVQTLLAAEQKFSTLELSVAKATVTNLGSYSYSGTALEPYMTVQLNGMTLVEGMDYLTSYTGNNKVGTAKVTIRGIGSFTGTLTKTFTIRAKAIAGVDVTGLKAKYVYTKKAITPAVSVMLYGKKLTKNKDYTLRYSNNVKRGTATITITGIGNYTGSTQVYFTIARNTIKNAKVSGVKKAYARTGKSIKPKVKVKVSGVTLKKGMDYSISYKKNKKRGKATITIKGKGNYTGTKKVTFKIV